MKLTASTRVIKDPSRNFVYEKSGKKNLSFKIKNKRILVETENGNGFGVDIYLAFQDTVAAEVKEVLRYVSKCKIIAAEKWFILAFDA